jgi:protein-disulfide isomerase
MRAVLAAFLAAMLLLGGCGDEERAATTPSSPKVEGVQETTELLGGVPQEGLVLGDKSAPITMVEILDLQCPFCRKHQLDVQPKVIDKLVRTGRVQLHLVPVGFLGADSQRMEIVLLRLAAKNKAWDFANLVYWNQGQEGSGYATDAWLRDIVAAIPGTDPADAASLASTTPDAAITRTAQVANAIAQASVQRAGGGGTPFFTVGKTGTPAQHLTPILSGSPPDSYDQILEAVQAVEAGREPEALKIPRSGGSSPTTAKGA